MKKRCSAYERKTFAIGEGLFDIEEGSLEIDFMLVTNDI